MEINTKVIISITDTECLTPYFFHDGDPYYTETSSLMFTANQWTDIYMIGTSVMSKVTAWCPLKSQVYLNKYVTEG